MSNFRLVLNVVLLLLGDSAASEFYIPTFRNTLFHLHRLCTQEELKNFEEFSWYIKFRRLGITQKKE
jgi:hypothetical protein